MSLDSLNCISSLLLLLQDGKNSSSFQIVGGKIKFKRLDKRLDRSDRFPCEGSRMSANLENRIDSKPVRKSLCNCSFLTGHVICTRGSESNVHGTIRPWTASFP